jgi:hypothetical protein
VAGVAPEGAAGTVSATERQSWCGKREVRCPCISAYLSPRPPRLAATAPA